MKYAVMANLSFSTPALRSNLAQAVKTSMGNKPTWGTIGLVERTDDKGRPGFGLEVRFYNRVDMDDLFALIKNRMDTLPVLTGSVSIHPCSHDGTPVSCVIEDQYVK